MFRSRFADAFPPKCSHVGPQDLERGVADEYPSPQIESLLCALLGLVLNRKKPVELVYLYLSTLTSVMGRAAVLDFLKQRSS